MLTIPIFSSSLNIVSISGEKIDLGPKDVSPDLIQLISEHEILYVEDKTIKIWDSRKKKVT